MKQVKFRIVQTILPLLIGMFLSLGAYAQQIYEAQYKMWHE